MRGFQGTVGQTVAIVPRETHHPNTAAKQNIDVGGVALQGRTILHGEDDC
jgi:hypothetical protein